MEYTFNTNSFETEVLNSDIPVLVDFFATWCGPCKMMAPNIEKAAEEYEGRIKVGKIDVDQEPLLAQSFNVETIPTVLIFKNGEIVASHIGAMPYELLQQFINKVL